MSQNSYYIICWHIWECAVKFSVPENVIADKPDKSSLFI